MPAGSEQTKVLQLNDFLCGATIDNMNLRKLLLFADKSRLVQKVKLTAFGLIGQVSVKQLAADCWEQMWMLP